MTLSLLGAWIAGIAVALYAAMAASRGSRPLPPRH